MRILLHPTLRALPRSAQRDLRSRVWLRFKTQVPLPSQRNAPKAPPPKTVTGTTPEPPTITSSAESVKTTIRKGPPERILIYYGGTGRSMFLGMLRVTTIFLFGAACFIVAPTCWADESQQWMTPLVIIGGAIPMLSFAYVAAPYVNFVHLALPAFARKSREMAVHYAKDLPPNAILYMNTMRWNTIPAKQPSVWAIWSQTNTPFDPLLSSTQSPPHHPGIERSLRPSSLQRSRVNPDDRQRLFTLSCGRLSIDGFRARSQNASIMWWGVGRVYGPGELVWLFL